MASFRWWETRRDGAEYGVEWLVRSRRFSIGQSWSSSTSRWIYLVIHRETWRAPLEVDEALTRAGSTKVDRSIRSGRLEFSGFEALPRRKGPSSERLASIRSHERWLATRQFAGLCGVVGMVVSVWRWWFAEPWIGRGWKVRVTTSTATSAASTASARFVAQIRSRPWYHPTRASCQHSSFNPSYDRILFSFLFNPSIVIIRAKMDSVVASYQVSCRPRGQRPVGMEIEVVRTVIWTLRDKGGWSRLNNHVEGPLLPHFRPHLDSHLRHLIPCSPLSRNCRYSNLNKYHPRTIISS